MNNVVGAAAQAEDIRDIRGPVEIPSALPWLLIGALAVAALLVALGVERLVRAWRRRAKSPYEQAKARLHAAAREAPRERGDLLAERASDAVRAYVEARFAVRATQRTTEEFLSELLLRQDTQLSAYGADLQRFLSTCDQAKFAGREVPDAVRAALCREALAFVDAAEASLREAAKRTPSLRKGAAT